VRASGIPATPQDGADPDGDAAAAPLRLAAGLEVAPIRLEAAVAAIPLVDVAALPLRLAPAAAPLAAPAPAPPPARMPGEAVGAWLRAARAARGLSVEALAARLKVTRALLEDVEAERRERLPHPVYLRGLLSSIAKELRLDGAELARAYGAGEPPPR
jgi:hypothetical protein